MAWIITKDHMKTGLIGRGVFGDDTKVSDCTKKFSIINPEGKVCYEGVATEDEPAERSVVIHAIGHEFKTRPRMETVAA